MGRRIDDHSFWAGNGSKDSVFPMGSKMKQYDSANSVGSINDYPDTSEKVKDFQNKNASQANKNKQPAGYRN